MTGGAVGNTNPAACKDKQVLELAILLFLFVLGWGWETPVATEVETYNFLEQSDKLNGS